MTEKGSEKENRSGKAEEPTSAYSKKIVVYSSFQEMDQATYEKWAKTSPIEHLRNAIAMTKKAYGWTGRENYSGNSEYKIKIIRYE